MQYKSKENMDYRRLFSFYCDSNLTSWSSLYNFVQKFLIKISFRFAVVFKFFPALYASTNRFLWNNTPCVRIYYWATSLRNHRLFLIPRFELWNLSLAKCYKNFIVRNMIFWPHWLKPFSNFLLILIGKLIEKCMTWYTDKWLDIDCLSVSQ